MSDRARPATGNDPGSAAPPPATTPRPAALDLAETVLDRGSWLSWDTPPTVNPVTGPYAEQLARARERSGADESVLTGEGRVRGHRVALLLSEFGFLAGSIGAAARERLLGAIRRATADGLPLIAATASGGTRMQEGTSAFVGMLPIAAAIGEHKAAGLPYLVHLRSPTTGGVLASWASLGHLTSGEPGALVGFLGPRVYQALNGAAFPEGVQTAENLHRRGILDAVLPTERLRTTLAAVLDTLAPAEPTTDVTGTPVPATPDATEPDAAADVWRSVTLTRDRNRPGLADLLRAADSPAVHLGGSGGGEPRDELRLALARFHGMPCVVVGHDRARARALGEAGPVGPGGLRAARRGMRLAAGLGLPLLGVIDTAGARLSAEAEESALSAGIARCLVELSALPVPVLSLLLGQGAGGGALALLPADRVLAAEHAWLAPLPPEGASAILYRTTDRAAELAREQRIGAPELLRSGTVHRIVPEPVPASADPQGFLRRVAAAVGEELAALAAGAGAGPRPGGRGAPLERLDQRLRARRLSPGAGRQPGAGPGGGAGGQADPGGAAGR
ncbi:acetyl-CoA carboxyl transferase [Streptacidiphilus sp. 4-A2]|nr:acetyl-CoA carboxyl transferase [Streptacidiphilus sp. 4-A2]